MEEHISNTYVTDLNSFLRSIVHAPEHSIRYLYTRPKKWKYSAIGSYDIESWIKRELLIDLESWMLGSTQGAMSIGFRAAEAKRAIHFPPTMSDGFAADCLRQGHFEYGLVFELAAEETGSQLSLTAIGIRLWQLRHGNLPKSLAQLVPSCLPVVPSDPVDGLPLRYQRISESKFRLHSIGYDGQDNQGESELGANALERPSGRLSQLLKWSYGKDWIWPQEASDSELPAEEKAMREILSEAAQARAQISTP